MSVIIIVLTDIFCSPLDSGPNRGHYIAIVKSHDFWLLFDDDIVEVIKHVHNSSGSNRSNQHATIIIIFFFFLSNSAHKAALQQYRFRFGFCNQETRCYSGEEKL